VTPSLAQAHLDALVERQQLDPVAVGRAGPTFDARALDDERERARELGRMTREPWAVGVDAQASAALSGVCDAGIASAEAALAELERRRAQSIVARPTGKRLAERPRPRPRGEARVEPLARDRLTRVPPELTQGKHPHERRDADALRCGPAPVHNHGHARGRRYAVREQRVLRVEDHGVVRDVRRPELPPRVVGGGAAGQEGRRIELHHVAAAGALERHDVTEEHGLPRRPEGRPREREQGRERPDRVSHRQIVAETVDGCASDVGAGRRRPGLAPVRPRAAAAARR
jgi:hypothetical protein